MRAVLLRFTASVYVYLAISFPLVFASSDLLTHIYTLKKHGRAPTIVFSPDGKLMAGGSAGITDATVNVWSMDDLQPVYSIKGVSRDVAFSPEGSVFVTCLKNAVQLWDVETWRVLGILAGHTGEIFSVTFSHDGQILATGDWDGTIKLWDISTQRNILTVNGHKHPDFDQSYRLVSSLEFSPNDKILASASWDNTVKLWNVDTGDVIATLNHVGSVYTAAFSPDGATLVSGASGGPQQRETLKIWDARTGSNIATFDGETVKSVDFSSNGNFLVVAEGQAVSVLDAGTWTRLSTCHAVAPWFVEFSPDDSILVSSSWYGDIMIWAMWDASPSDLFPAITVSEETTQVVIPDTNLRNVIATASEGLVKSAFTETKMSQISRIVGSHSNIGDLTGLESATNLAYLYLDFNSVTDISALRNLTNLNTLRLGANLISDISPLSSLTNLTELGLSKNSIADISALGHLTELTFLSLGENPISDISPLSSLTNLEALYLRYSSIADISALRHLTNLTRLNLEYNSIVDTSALQHLTKLIELDLDGNLIFDISMLSRLTELHFLYVGKNFVSDISPVAGLPKLVILTLNDNNISDISALSGLVNLGEVNLNGNNVEDLQSLVSSTGMGAGDEVDVRNNPLNRSSLLVHIPALIERGVEVLYDDVEPPITADVNNDGTVGSGIGYAFSETPVHIGDTFTLDVRAEDVLDFGGWQFDISFDTNLLEAVSANEGDFLKSGGGSTFFQGGRIDNASGKIIGLNSALLADHGISGSGNILHVRFKAKSGGETEVTLQNLQFGSITGEEIPVDPHGITFTVEGRLAREDVNRDGIVSILDLILVARQLGQRVSADSPEDINSDGVVNIFDLTLVAQGIGNTTATAPAVGTEPTDTITIEGWIEMARLEDDGSIAFRQGIENLLSLLASFIPKETALHANYPNPSNPETWIPYQLEAPAEVTLTIYDMSGGAVRRLNLGNQEAGVYHSQNRAAYWDGRNQRGEPVASGIYFYALSAGEFTATRKMLIRK